jgi:hypothetical protein
MNYDFSPIFDSKLEQKHSTNLKLIVSNCQNYYAKEDDAILRNRLITEVIDGYVNYFHTKDIIEIIPVAQPTSICPLTKQTILQKTYKMPCEFFSYIDNKILEIIRNNKKVEMKKVDFYNFIKSMKFDELLKLNFYCASGKVELNSFSMMSPMASFLQSVGESLKLPLNGGLMNSLKDNEILIHKQNTIGLIFYPYSFLYTNVLDETGFRANIKRLSRFHIGIGKDYEDAYKMITLID